VGGILNGMVARCNSVKSTITNAYDPTHYQTVCASEVVVQVFDIIWTGLRCSTTGGVCVCVCTKIKQV